LINLVRQLRNLLPGMESQRVHSAAAESIMNIPIISSQVVSNHCNNVVDFSVTLVAYYPDSRPLSLSLSLSLSSCLTTDILADCGFHY